MDSDVTRAIKSFLKSDKLLKQINFTQVALIPKVHEPKHMSNMRLISLYNVLFKIASKALANRLKAFLPHIISHHQSAFVPRKLISDNTILAAEISHYLF